MSEDVPIDLDRIVAAILTTVGPVSIKLKTLLDDYTNYSVMIKQDTDDEITLELVEGVDDES
jgi:hypothetical protein